MWRRLSGISRTDQTHSRIARRKRQRLRRPMDAFQRRSWPVEIPQRKGPPVLFSQDEHPRPTTLVALGRFEGSIPAGWQRNGGPMPAA